MQKMRGDKPFLFTNMKTGRDIDVVADFIIQQDRLADNTTIPNNVSSSKIQLTPRVRMS
ncbi:MAG: hypothetical protein WAU91_01320 [Desulfatitalea sp.]